MPSSNMKLLLHALRLGQPQDPKAAVFVLAEELAAHEEAIEDLRRRLTLAQSQAAIHEAKATRLEAEVETLRALVGRAAHASNPPPAQPQPQPQPGSVRPPPPDPQIEVTGEESSDDFRVETVVVRNVDVAALSRGELPFQMAPQSTPRPGPQGSIPGAPWARERGAHHVQPAMEEYTIDAPSLAQQEQERRGPEDLEAETFADRGGPDRLVVTATNHGGASRSAALRSTPVMEGEGGKGSDRNPHKR